MFTGIIEEVGTIQSLRKGTHSATFTISAKEILHDVKLGDSISVNGVCLTVAEFTSNSFHADVMHETLNRSSLGDLKIGSSVNLERAMAMGSRFGGHIVSGHIDGTGVITKVKKDDNAIWYTIRTTPAIMRYIIEKGSIAVDGISLTVANITPNDFSVSIIPHTAQHTNLREKGIGSTVNLEVDCIGKYVEKLLGQPKQNSNITKEFLLKFDY